MRPTLTLSIRSLALVLYNLRGWRERAISLNREQRDTAPVVIGDEHDSASAVHAHEARSSTARRLIAESSERAGVARDREGAHRTGRLPVVRSDFIHRVENAAIRVHGEERWVRAGVHRADLPRFPGARIHSD